MYRPPGPYACAEWDFGGYPYWLLRDRDMHIRANDPKVLAVSGRYVDAWAKQVVPLQVTRGGRAQRLVAGRQDRGRRAGRPLGVERVVVIKKPPAPSIRAPGSVPLKP